MNRFLGPEARSSAVNIRFVRIAEIAYIVGGAAHFLLIFHFLWLEVFELMCFNIFFSTPAFAIAFVINRRGFHGLAFSLAYTELLTHQIIGVCYLGWASGFQYWLIYLAGLSYFNANWNDRIRFSMIAIIISAFAILYVFFKTSPHYKLSDSAYDRFYLFNSLSTILLIAFLIDHYVQAATKAEQELGAANRQLEEKNLQTERQKAEIIESIAYAEKIQKSVLPKASFLDSLFTDSFILFRPKDIVSGDFYWFSDTEGKIVVVCADCTGHGVPGGLMSMLGVSHLNELVDHQKITASARILEGLRRKIKESLRQKGKRNEQQDGMDMAVCVFDRQNEEMAFAGANNGVFIIRKGELRELRPTRNPVGVHRKEIPFAQTSVRVGKGDLIYLYTDGYVDQFGGENGRKLKKAKLKDLLLQYHGLPMSEQKSGLELALADWMKGHHQVDDITLIGIRK